MSLAAVGGTLYAGGGFPGISGELRSNLAAFYDPALLDVPSSQSRPSVLDLLQNTPNPFASSTRIRFSLPSPGAVRLGLYDPAGRRVRTLLDVELLAAGPHEYNIDAARIAPGLYWYRLEWNEEFRSRRLVVIP